METLQRTANRGSVSTGYDIDNSLKIEDDNTEHMTRTYSEAGVKTKGTISFWHKRTEIQSGVKRPVDCHDGSSSNSSGIFIDGHRLCFDFGGNGRHSLRANALMRDTSAWYHLMATWDTSQGTDSNRTKIYINGEQVTDLHEATYPSQNAEVQFFTNTGGGSQANKLFCQATNTSNHPNGYFAEFHYVNNSQLSPTDFGEYDSNSGIWKPKEYTGTYGDTGFYLDFADASDLGDDESGNGNDFTEVNIAAADQATDTPTNNFAIGNILTSAGGFLVPTEGATKGVLSTSGPGNNTGGASLFSTIPVSNGKWYFEAQNTNSGDVYLYLGVGDVGGIENWGIDGKTLGSATGPSVGWRGGGAQDGKVYINNSATGSADTWETEVVGVALDLDNNKVYFHKSGTYINSGDPASGTDNGGQYDLPTAVDDQWCIGVSAYNLATWLLNFGGYTTMSISSAASDANGYGTFEYAPPSGLLFNYAQKI
jgi:hypothetical protein